MNTHANKLKTVFKKKTLKMKTAHLPSTKTIKHSLQGSRVD